VDFDAWSTAAARVGHCAKPVRLRGFTCRIDTTTGEVVSAYSTDGEPLGVLHVRCGNRRASECPSCSRVYAADTFHLIRSGVTGGKGVPVTVGDNPLVFATLTAPSFGAVHGHRDRNRACRPYGKGTCEHGRPLACHTVHTDGDELLGQPVCGDCYDYTGHIVWQWWAPELWRRFTIALRRNLAHTLAVSESRLGTVATVQYAKVAEYQARGLIHFHALIRLDGPKTDRGFAPAPTALDAADVARLITAAVTTVSYAAPPVHAGDTTRVLRFGIQVDTRRVRIMERGDEPDRELTAEQVAGYLAKYATKSATDTCPQGNLHLRRLRNVLADVAEASAHVDDRDDELRGSLDARKPYRLLGKWTHMLGFRGHFSTKSRRYSVTLGQLRRARRRWHNQLAQAQRTGRPLDEQDLDEMLLRDDDDTTLVIGQWAYAGTGWDNDGDAELAKAAAARAREYAQYRAHTRNPSGHATKRAGG